MTYRSLFCFLLVALSSYSSAQIFLEEPQDIIVPSGSKATVSFKCEARVDSPSYMWRKDDQNLDLSTNPRLAAYGGTLEIASPQMSDAGFYQCVVISNEGKAASNYGKLQFAYINPFSEESTGLIETSTGEGVSIPCSGADYSPDKSVKFYWQTRIDINVLKPPGTPEHYISQKNGTLYFANPTPSDNEVYFCTVRSLWHSSGTQPIEEDSPATELRVTGQSGVFYSPKFLLTTKELAVVRGGMALIECFASGNPTPTITWRRSTGGLPGNHTITPAGQLLLTNINDDYAGDYICTAANDQGQMNSITTVTLEYMPQWTEEISSTEADLYSSPTFHCGATSVPDPNFTWLKDAEVLSGTEHVEITYADQTSTLRINNATLNDTGIYQCIPYNTRGNLFSSAKLNIEARAPKLIERVPDVTRTSAGDDVTITCEVSAAPAADVTWAKDDGDVIIDGMKYVLMDSGSLLIRDVAFSDKGQYVCRAINQLGSVESRGYLQVYDPTEIKKGPESLELAEGSDGKMTCKAFHDSALAQTWTWKKDGETLKPSVHCTFVADTLTIIDATREQSGSYSCCASTVIDEACASANVVVLVSPDPPTNVLVTSIEDVRIGLTWQMTDNNGITSYFIEGKTPYDQDWMPMTTDPPTVERNHCDVVDLLPYNLYNFRVTAENKIGKSLPSEESSTSRTVSGAPVIAPSNLGGGGGNLGELVVTWESLQPKYYGGKHLTYKVEVRKVESKVIEEEGTRSSWSKIELDNPNATIVIFSVNRSEFYVPYQARIQAKNDNGAGPFSNVTTLYTGEEAPTTAPAGFVVNWTLAYSALFSWKALEVENGHTTGYYVRLCDITVGCADPNLWTNGTTTGSDPVIQVNGLRSNVGYKVSIAGFNTGGMGPFSGFNEGAMFSTEGEPPEVAPVNIQLWVMGQCLTASWDAVDAPQPVRGYKVQYWLKNATSAEARSRATGKTDISFHLPTKADWYVWVRAYNDGGDGRPTATIAVSSQKGAAAEWHQPGGASATKGSFAFVLSTTILWLSAYTLL